MLFVKKKPIVTALRLLLIVLPSTKNEFAILLRKKQKKVRKFGNCLLNNTQLEPGFTRKTNTYSLLRLIKPAKALLSTRSIAL